MQILCHAVKPLTLLLLVFTPKVFGKFSVVVDLQSSEAKTLNTNKPTDNSSKILRSNYSHFYFYLEFCITWPGENGRYANATTTIYGTPNVCIHHLDFPFHLPRPSKLQLHVNAFENGRVQKRTALGNYTLQADAQKAYPLHMLVVSVNNETTVHVNGSYTTNCDPYYYGATCTDSCGNYETNHRCLENGTALCFHGTNANDSVGCVAQTAMFNTTVTQETTFTYATFTSTSAQMSSIMSETVQSSKQLSWAFSFIVPALLISLGVGSCVTFLLWLGRKWLRKSAAGARHPGSSPRHFESETETVCQNTEMCVRSNPSPVASENVQIAVADVTVTQSDGHAAAGELVVDENVYEHDNLFFL